MSMKIISADERLKQQTGVKMVIFGGFGIGKTFLNIRRTSTINNHLKLFVPDKLFGNTGLLFKNKPLSVLVNQIHATHRMLFRKMLETCISNKPRSS